MGEISEALRRAREEEEERRQKARAPRPSEFAESLRIAAVEEAVDQSDADWSPAIEATIASEVQPDLPTPVPLSAPSNEIITPGHDLSEVCRHLANRVLHELERREQQTLAVVSALSLEGKSTVSSNLALSLASLSRGRTVALLDLDLRRPTLALKLGLSPRRGIDEVIEGKAKLDDARISLSSPALDVYPCMGSHNSAHELLVGPALATVIDELRSRYSVVVVDTPPVILVPDASLILRKVDGFIVVARMGYTKSRHVAQMLDLLPLEKRIGCVLNQTRFERHAGSYEYYRYGDSDEDANLEETQTGAMSDSSRAEEPA